jgi:hypothetical protein
MPGLVVTKFDQEGDFFPWQEFTFAKGFLNDIFGPLPRR